MLRIVKQINGMKNWKTALITKRYVSIPGLFFQNCVVSETVKFPLAPKFWVFQVNLAQTGQIQNMQEAIIMITDHFFVASKVTGVPLRETAMYLSAVKKMEQ